MVTDDFSRSDLLLLDGGTAISYHEGKAAARSPGSSPAVPRGRTASRPKGVRFMRISLPSAILLVLIRIAPLGAEEADDFDEAFPLMATRLAAAEAHLTGKRIAVYGFDVIGRPGDTYARYATEKLTHEIVVQGHFLVIERSRLDEILKEQNFSLTGAVDPATAARIGKILSVDAVVAGTILVTEERTEFIVRVIQSETGMIMSSADVYVYADEEDDGEDAGTSANNHQQAAAIKTQKTRYASSEKITVTWSGFPGNENDWITLVPAKEPDTSYGQWFYTQEQEEGSHTFDKVAAGDYEIRAYFDWPAGGYTVQGRIKLTVK